MKIVSLISVALLIASTVHGRIINAMSYEQMWAASDSVFIGRVEKAERQLAFEVPKEFLPVVRLRCWILTIRVYCVLKGEKPEAIQLKSYDYEPSGNPKEDFMRDYFEPPFFLGDASGLMKTDSMWFLRDGAPITGQVDAGLSVIRIATSDLRSRPLPSQATPGAVTPAAGQPSR